MSIKDQVRGDFEIKSVIEEMYYCRVDEFHLEECTKKELTLQELEKLPEDIAKEILNSKEETTNKTIGTAEETDDLNKRIYTTGFKDGVNMILESLD